MKANEDKIVVPPQIIKDNDGRDLIVLDEEQSAKVLEAQANNMTCMVCPYFKMYDVAPPMGFIGKCRALDHLATKMARKGILGRIRAYLMRLLAKGTWSLVVEKCPYYQRAARLESRGETIP